MEGSPVELPPHPDYWPPQGVSQSEVSPGLTLDFPLGGLPGDVMFPSGALASEVRAITCLPGEVQFATPGCAESITCQSHASPLILGSNMRGTNRVGVLRETFPGDLGSGFPEFRGEEELSEGKRMQILQFIESHPGTHLRGIMRGLDLPMGVLQYHLDRLEKGRAIVSRRRYLYRRYYRSLLFTENEEAVLDALSQESEGNILVLLVSKPDQTLADIARSSRLANSTVFWHLKRLIAIHLVVARRQGGRVVYSLGVGREVVLKLTKSYHPTLWERLSDRLADAVLSAGGATEEAGENLLTSPGAPEEGEG